jgi:MobA/MobL family protein
VVTPLWLEKDERQRVMWPSTIQLRDVASYHLSVHPNVSRGKGQSLVRTAAYNARARLSDERTGKAWDYRRYGAVLFEGIYAAKAPDWARDLERLVNGIERAERRADAQLAMNIDIALPHEQTLEQNRRLLQDFVRVAQGIRGACRDPCPRARGRSAQHPRACAGVAAQDRAGGFCQHQGIAAGALPQPRRVRRRAAREVGNARQNRHAIAGEMHRCADRPALA